MKTLPVMTTVGNVLALSAVRRVRAVDVFRETGEHAGKRSLRRRRIEHPVTRGAVQIILLIGTRLQLKPLFHWCVSFVHMPLAQPGPRKCVFRGL